MKYSIGALLCLLVSSANMNASSAFLMHRSCRCLRMVQDWGWDNDNYLDALSGGAKSNDKLDKANSRYFQQSDARMANYERVMKLKMGETSSDDNALFGGQGNVEGVPDKPPKPAPIDEDNPHGGQMLRRLMERAEEAKKMGGVPPPQPRPPQPEPVAYTPPPPQTYAPPPPQPVAPTGTMLTPEQQIAMMQQQMQVMQTMMQQMQQMQMGIAPPVQQQPVAPVQQQPVAPVQQQPVAPVETVDPLSEAPGFEAPKPVEGVRADVMKYAPRAPEGRNRDAYEINNNADVYFAQLKRDSIVRNKARREGNLEAANSVFGEEGTQALAGYFSDEVVRTRRERNKDMYSTSRDEMVIPLEEDGETEAEKAQKMAYTGVSYRDALARKKKNQNNPPPGQE